MEELYKIAKAYYQASPRDIRKLAKEFFDRMDTNRDEKVDFNEFSEFTRTKGSHQMTKLSFFKQLDQDGNGTLDFWEVMTLYYIVQTGRPFCDQCDKFIPSTYLKCVGCMEAPERRSLYLCLDCYMSENKRPHTHNGLSRFLDNYTLLEAMNKSKQKELLRSPETRSRTSGKESVLDEASSSHRSSSQRSSSQRSSSHRSARTALSIQNNTSIQAYSAQPPAISTTIPLLRSPETRSRTSGKESVLDEASSSHRSSSQRSSSQRSSSHRSARTALSIQNNTSIQAYSAQPPATSTTIPDNWATTLAVFDAVVTASVIGSNGFCSIL